MLQFCNGDTEDLWVAYMFYSPNTCGGDGGDWQAIGWFHVTPGACVTVYANDLHDVNNRFWYSYVENASRTRVWAGPVTVQVLDIAFNHCLEPQTLPNPAGRRNVGFRIFDVGDSNNAILTITP